MGLKPMRFLEGQPESIHTLVVADPGAGNTELIPEPPFGALYNSLSTQVADCVASHVTGEA